MQLRAPIAIKAALKSLTQVIAPAIDPDNKLAQEQFGLIVGLLTLIGDRLPLEFHYDVDELRRLTRLGHDLQEIAVSAALAEPVTGGEDVLARAAASPDELIAAIAALRSAIGQTAQQLSARSDPVSQRGVRAILANASEQQLRERSWLLLQGWETNPASVPAIETLIGAPSSGRRGQ